VSNRSTKAASDDGWPPQRLSYSTTAGDAYSTTEGWNCILLLHLTVLFVVLSLLIHLLVCHYIVTPHPNLISAISTQTAASAIRSGSGLPAYRMRASPETFKAPRAPAKGTIQQQRALAHAPLQFLVIHFILFSSIYVLSILAQLSIHALSSCSSTRIRNERSSRAIEAVRDSSLRKGQ